MNTSAADRATNRYLRLAGELLADGAERGGACRCGFPRADYFFNDGHSIRATCKGCAVASEGAGGHAVLGVAP